MDATAWTVAGAAIAILVALATSFRSLRHELRAQGQDLRERGDAQGKELREHIDAQVRDLREDIDAQGRDLRERIDAQGKEISQLRERMARLEGLLEGLREAITGKRVA